MSSLCILPTFVPRWNNKEKYFTQRWSEAVKGIVWMLYFADNQLSFRFGSRTDGQNGGRGKDIWLMPARTLAREGSDLSSTDWCSRSRRTVLLATATPPTTTGRPRCPPPPSPRGSPGASTPPSFTTSPGGLISITGKNYLDEKNDKSLTSSFAACQPWGSTWAACSRPPAWTAPPSCQVWPQSPQPWRAPRPRTAATPPPPPPTTPCTRIQCPCTKTQCQDILEWLLQSLHWD